MAAAALLLAGCAGGPGRQADGPPANPPPDLANIANAVPRKLPLSRSGNPPSYSVLGKTYHVLTNADGYDRTGIASWYGTKFQGRRTSSGEPYDMYAMTAASKTLPIPSFVRVTNLRNERHVVVKVNDRGPFHRGRIIDLSYAAAGKLGMLQRGSTRVRVQSVSPEPPLQTVKTAATSAQSAAAPDPPLRMVANDIVYLQVGAFQHRAHADKLADRLRRAGIDWVFVMPPKQAADRFYRVRIGPFNDTAALAATRARLQILNVGFRAIAGDLSHEAPVN